MLCLGHSSFAEEELMSSPRSAFTLIELLVSMALIAIIATAATTTFIQLLTMSRKLQAMQTMDAAAKTAYEKLAGEVTVIHPCAAVWLTAKAATKDVEFVFMRSKFNRLDYIDTKFRWDVGGDLGYTDLVWSRWHWNASTEMLEVSSSRTCRWTVVSNDQTRNYWKIPSGSKMNNTNSTFVSLPQLQRDTGTASDPDSPIGILNLNSWNTGEKTDVGDYDDLTLNAVPLLYRCTDLVFEVKNLDGSVKTADGTADLSWAAPGTFVDGQDHPKLVDRPSIVRLRFTLTEPKAKTSRTYSFSCTAPSFTHY
jgi:prepilin-type N-terminal cleavage/methylation domain-containing protein